MIDFSNGSVFKLSPANPQDIGPAVAPLFIQDEQIIACFKAVRDFVVFTNKRLIAVIDLDAELDLWFSGLGKVRLEFKGNADIRYLGQMIAGYVL